jgi:hypothetical protein
LELLLSLLIPTGIIVLLYFSALLRLLEGSYRARVLSWLLIFFLTLSETRISLIPRSGWDGTALTRLGRVQSCMVQLMAIE